MRLYSLIGTIGIDTSGSRKNENLKIKGFYIYTSIKIGDYYSLCLTPFTHVVTDCRSCGMSVKLVFLSGDERYNFR